ncbi:hypothetical protein ACQ4M3_41870 [Leptolyngbya sp. AN03gr2]|uniref:hypothetical protein n=1 Tax=unclassified Leptolyngbya TaxID=2650499 RepID=UPI003D31151B
MNTPNSMNFAQRALAVLSASGAAALMTLPAFAQAVPTQGVVNNGDINRVNPQVQTTDNCAFVTGGVGGPIDTNNRQSVTPNRQFDANNRSAAIAFRANGPAGTSGHEAKLNLNAVEAQRNNYAAAYNVGRGSRTQAIIPTRQFDANNPSAAIAYRDNGPAGTSGHEAKLNLNIAQARQSNSSYPAAYNLSSPQASAPLPVACTPR